MKITSADFIASAFEPKDYPPDTLPEVAFSGKSNVGKSSLINRLVNRKGLARTSATPGRTQSINFFRINERISFVDLPGYGFAKVPPHIQQQWKPMVESYLRTRKSLCLAVVILDIRREPSGDDINLVDWLAVHGISLLAVATKVDKLSKNQRIKQKAVIERKLHLAEAPLVMFSAVTGEGKEEVWKRIGVRLKP